MSTNHTFLEDQNVIIFYDYGRGYNSIEDTPRWKSRGMFMAVKLPFPGYTETGLDWRRVQILDSFARNGGQRKAG
jgi:hypothetical protein